MGENMLQVLKQTGIFMVCAQMLLHFKPSEVYGKYIRLLMSIMVLALLIGPIMELFGQGSSSLEERAAYYDEILSEESEEARQTGAKAQALLEKMTLEEVKSELNKIQEEDGEEEKESEEAERNGEEPQTAGAGAGELVERIEVKLYD